MEERLKPGVEVEPDEAGHRSGEVRRVVVLFRADARRMTGDDGVLADEAEEHTALVLRKGEDLVRVQTGVRALRIDGVDDGLDRAAVVDALCITLGDRLAIGDVRDDCLVADLTLDAQEVRLFASVVEDLRDLDSVTEDALERGLNSIGHGLLHLRGGHFLEVGVELLDALEEVGANDGRGVNLRRVPALVDGDRWRREVRHLYLAGRDPALCRGERRLDCLVERTADVRDANDGVACVLEHPEELRAAAHCVPDDRASGAEEALLSAADAGLEPVLASRREEALRLFMVEGSGHTVDHTGHPLVESLLDRAEHRVCVEASVGVHRRECELRQTVGDGVRTAEDGVGRHVDRKVGLLDLSSGHPILDADLIPHRGKESVGECVVDNGVVMLLPDLRELAEVARDVVDVGDRVRTLLTDGDGRIPIERRRVALFDDIAVRVHRRDVRVSEHCRKRGL